MPSNTCKKRYLEPDFGVHDCSILSQVTNKALTIKKLVPFTDKSLTKNNPKVLNYKKAKVYDCGGDIKKQWFVYYSFRDPDTGVFKRIRVFKDINSFKTKAERLEIAKYYVTVYNEWLEMGGSPHGELKDPGSDQNIISCIDNFIDFSQGSKMRPNTKDKYRLQFGVFKNWLIDAGHSNLTIAQIKKQIVFEYMQYVKKRPGVTSGKTINDYITNLSTFFNHYIDNYDDFLDRNPVKKMTREPVQKRGNIAFTDEEFAAIKGYLLKTDPYLWFVCQVVYYTGLRNEAEALEIKIGDLDFKRDVLWVEAFIAKNKIKQSVPIYPEFKELLLSLKINEYPKDFYLLGRGEPGAKKIGIDVFPERFRKVKKHFGLGRQYGLYCFKSTRACHLYDDGAAIRDIQTLFRHQTPLITMEYLKSLGRVERERVLDKGRKI